MIIKSNKSTWGELISANVVVVGLVGFPTQKLAWEQGEACCQENHYFPLPVWLGSALLFNINWCCLVLDPATAPPWTCCTTVACVSKESYQCCPRGHKNCQKMMKLFTIRSSKAAYVVLGLFIVSAILLSIKWGIGST